MLLDGLRECPLWTGLPQERLEAFVQLVPEVHPNDPDFLTLALPTAEAYRVAGLPSRAAELLDGLEQTCATAKNLFALREVFEARGRLGWAGDRRPQIPFDLVWPVDAELGQNAFLGVLYL
jgi:hypothetical protein